MFYRPGYLKLPESRIWRRLDLIRILLKSSRWGYFCQLFLHQTTTPPPTEEISTTFTLCLKKAVRQSGHHPPDIFLSVSSFMEGHLWVSVFLLYIFKRIYLCSLSVRKLFGLFGFWNCQCRDMCHDVFQNRPDKVDLFGLESKQYIGVILW